MQLTQVMAKAVHEQDFRSRFVENPKVILDELNIAIPADQNVTVLESQAGEIFFILPVLTEEDVTQLRHSLNTVHPQRSVRSRILLKVREDPDYKAKLLQEPKTTLKAEGLPIPNASTVTVLENSPEQLYIVLPHIHSHAH
jgi:Nitrile hydratase, alpha chain